MSLSWDLCQAGGGLNAAGLRFNSDLKREIKIALFSRYSLINILAKDLFHKLLKFLLNCDAICILIVNTQCRKKPHMLFHGNFQRKKMLKCGKNTPPKNCDNLVIKMLQNNSLIFF